MAPVVINNRVEHNNAEYGHKKAQQVQQIIALWGIFQVSHRLLCYFINKPPDACKTCKQPQNRRSNKKPYGEISPGELCSGFCLTSYQCSGAPFKMRHGAETLNKAVYRASPYIWP